MQPETAPFDYADAVAEFHRAFRVPYTFGTDTGLAELLKLRATLVTEEFHEVIEALADAETVTSAGLPVSQLEHLAKELADLLVVTFGTADLLGIPMGKAFAAVHASNMSKLGDDGRPVLREDGKVMKGPNYQHADMTEVGDDIVANYLSRHRTR
ncbi:MazG nucleotide pyrophosphohydrolase domain-containing protein [Streptomyces sp. BH105]|uniref:MazG nucleotide pyrophosphohydrolase domain-containing protein n=1 Tax=Streptomyces sp. BH105 TaxID=3410408 RepID=UPI003CFA31C6